MRIFNTLTKQKEELPPSGSELKMFVCGPTVYDYIHIGNARTFVLFDVFAKYLRYTGYKIKYIQNITDIDDRIIERAKETNADWKEVSQKFEEIFKKNASDLKISGVKYCKATDYIPQIIKQVSTLIEKGNAYLIEGDGYYFDLKSFPEYGKLSGRTAEMADDAVSRVDENSKKRNKGDFCLWKFAQPGEPSCPADIGDGRPGWHIEDTAITETELGQQYDIHGGGQDLIFPHHEAEIAQQESASGLKPFVKYWVHTGFLVNKGGKMSKSLGNFLTIEEALKKYSPEALRFYFLSAHYRSPLDYTEENLKQAEAAVMRIAEFRNNLARIPPQVKNNDISKWPGIRGIKARFFQCFDDDFNTPQALGVLFELMKEINQIISEKKLDFALVKEGRDIIKVFYDILGIIPARYEYSELPSGVKVLVEKREEARAQKDFSKADELREKIKNLGYEVDDTAYGPLVKEAR